MERIYRALYADASRRRPAGHRGDPRGAQQYPLSSGLYRLAGAQPRLAGRRPHELCRPCRGRASVGGRLSGRSAVERERGSEELVRADEVAPVVPPAAGRDGCAAFRRRSTTPTSTSDTIRPAIKAALARAPRAQHGFDVVGVDAAGRDPGRRRAARPPSSPTARTATWTGWRDARRGGDPRALWPEVRSRHHARHELRARRTIRCAVLAAARPRRDLGLRAGRRLSRDHQAAAQGARALAGRAMRAAT